MIADFIFFIGIAAICFSGLLFTLHNLGTQVRAHSLGVQLMHSMIYP